MPAMKRGSDERNREKSLDAARKIEVPVLEHVGHSEDRLENHDANQRRAQREDRSEPERQCE